MKTTLLIITMLFALTAIGQNTMKAIQKKDSTTTVIKQMQPEKIADKIITLDSSNKVSKKTIAVQNDTIQAKSKVIEDLKLQMPSKGAGLGNWINFLLGVLAIVVVWCLSFIKKLSQSKIPLLQRLAGEASDFVKKIQYSCTAISVIIPTLMGTITLGDTLTSILGTIEIICLAIAGFSLFLVKKPEELQVNKTTTVQ